MLKKWQNVILFTKKWEIRCVRVIDLQLKKMTWNYRWDEIIFIQFCELEIIDNNNAVNEVILYKLFGSIITQIEFTLKRTERKKEMTMIYNIGMWMWILLQNYHPVKHSNYRIGFKNFHCSDADNGRVVEW